MLDWTIPIDLAPQTESGMVPNLKQNMLLLKYHLTKLTVLKRYYNPNLVRFRFAGYNIWRMCMRYGTTGLTVLVA